MKTCSWPLCVLWYSCFIPRRNFLVSYSSDPSHGIFFVCKHEGRSKDPRCKNWNCQLVARFLHPQMKIQIVFRKLLQYRHWSCFSLSNKRSVSVLFRSKERPTNEILGFGRARNETRAKNEGEGEGNWTLNLLQSSGSWYPPTQALALDQGQQIDESNE